MNAKDSVGANERVLSPRMPDMNDRGIIGNIVAVADSIRRTPVTRRLALLMSLVALYAAIVVSAGALLKEVEFHLEPDIHAFVGFVMGLLLVFRTNTAYDRWWEARKLWGQLVNDSRNLAVKVNSLSAVTVEDKRRVGQRVVEFAYSLCASLRESHFSGQSPVDIVSDLYRCVRDWASTGVVDGFEVALLDVHLRSFLDIVGGCERIRRTRQSVSYRAFVRHCIFIYLLLLPWCLVEGYGIWMVPAVVVVSYFMIGIEIIAETVEQPFGTSDDHIPLDEICQRLAQSIHEISAAGDVPLRRAA